MRQALLAAGLACLVGAGACSGSGTDAAGAGKSQVAGQGGGAAASGRGGAADSPGAAGGAGAAAGGLRGGSGVNGSGTAGTAGRAGSGGSAGTGGRAGGGGSAGTGNEAGATGAGDEGGGPNGSGLTSFKLAVVGSSTAAGEGASSAAKGWVSLLASSLDMTVVGDFSASNLAVGGYTTTELLPGSGANGSIDDALARDPNLILVSLAGSNDLSAGTSTDAFISRLKTLRDHAKEAGIPVFFVSTAPKDLSTSEQQTLQTWAGNMKAEFSGCWVPGQSDDYSPCFIDIFQLLANDSLGVASAYSAGDGIHLNDAGHAVIFEAARAVVEPYVCSLTACH